jgi:hypothetical protein
MNQHFLNKVRFYNFKMCDTNLILHFRCTYKFEFPLVCIQISCNILKAIWHVDMAVDVCETRIYVCVWFMTGKLNVALRDYADTQCRREPSRIDSTALCICNTRELNSVLSKAVCSLFIESNLSVPHDLHLGN